MKKEQIRKKTAVLVGYHGYQNFGDDIFFSVVCELISRAGYREIHVAHRAGGLPGFISGVCVKRIEGPLIRRIGRLKTFYTFLRCADKDLLLFSGGSIFGHQPLQLMNILMRLLKKTNKGIRSAALGVSLGPVSKGSSTRSLRKFLGELDVIQTRDDQCVEALGLPNLDQSYDLALNYFSRYKEKRVSSKRTEGKVLVGISPTARYLDRLGGQAEAFTETVDAALKDVSLTTCEVSFRILSACGESRDGDEQLSRRLRDQVVDLGYECELVFYKDFQIDDFISRIIECDFVFAARLHVGVAALFMGVPVLQLAYAEKLRDFYEAHGLPIRNIVPPSRFNLEEVVSFLSAVDKSESKHVALAAAQLDGAAELLSLKLDEFSSGVLN